MWNNLLMSTSLRFTSLKTISLPGSEKEVLEKKEAATQIQKRSAEIDVVLVLCPEIQERSAEPGICVVLRLGPVAGAIVLGLGPVAHDVGRRQRDEPSCCDSKLIQDLFFDVSHTHQQPTVHFPALNLAGQVE